MTVDLGALRKNYQTVQSMVGAQAHIIPSIKGDGYGIGAVAAAREFAAAGAHSVATGSINEALAIRESGNDVRIHMFPGGLPEAMPLLHRYSLTPSIYSMELASAASAAATRRWGVFIKVDVGFGRLGVPLDQAKQFALEVAKLPNLEVEGIFTHVPYGDEPGQVWAAKAIERFDDLVDSINQAGLEIPVTQCVASKGVLHGLHKASRCNAVSVGHLLFGGLGREPLGAEKHSAFVPAISQLVARLIHIRRHDHDGFVGSGGKLPVKAGAVTGTIPVGLHEGYRAAATGKTSFVLAKGHRVPVLFVSQEYTVVDLSGVDDIAVGDEVTVFGRAEEEFISIEEMADWQGQSPLHVVMNMNKRFPICYVDSST